MQDMISLIAQVAVAIFMAGAWVMYIVDYTRLTIDALKAELRR